MMTFADELVPLASVTVATSRCAPISEQSKVTSDSVHVKLPHASVVPSSTVDGITVTVPSEPSETCISVTAMFGAILSSTVTVAVVLCILPDTSVAVNVTVFAPTSLQSKLVISNDNVIEQLSLLPLSTSAVVMIA